MVYIQYMHTEHIKNADLNLLKALEALLETGSVSRAAERVNLSQPAMSRALDRLRHAMRDPLLVRSGRGMALTPRGEALRAPVRDALARASLVFKLVEFDPSNSQERFRLMMPDYLAHLIMPQVLAQVFEVAPGVRIDIENLSATGITELREGKVSLGFGVVDDGPRLETVASQALMRDRQVCLVRKEHPLSRDGVTLERYAAASHAMLSITGRGGGRIDDLLNDHGLSRTIVLRITQFMTISAIIAPTDLIITVPEILARQVMTDDLTQMELPFELQTPSVTVSQIWHERFSKDPGHRWLRGLIKSACK